MSRLTLGNAVKVGLVVAFLPLLAYLVLVIGSVKKNLRVGLEGALYAAGFSASLLTLDVIGLGGLLALTAMGASGVRAYHLRDLWLPARRRWWHRFVPSESQEQTPELASSSPAMLEPADQLSSALAAVVSRAHQKRHRLPAEAVPSLLETCRTLESVVEAERREPSGDPILQYELDAIVKEYLPAVVRGYLAIPPNMVDTRQPNGRTPKEELAEQLRILAGQAEAMQRTRSSRTMAQLSTTGNFLREKFGHSQKEAFDFGVK